MLSATAVSIVPASADTTRLIFNDPDLIANVTGSKLAFVDIDGDGDLDIFAGMNAGSIRYFENIGGNIQLRYVERTGAANPFNAETVGGRAAPAFADIDGDGDFDAVIGAADGSMRFYLNSGSGMAPVFVAQSGASNPFNGVSVGTRSAPVFVDLEGDGDYDALVGAYDGTIRYFQNTGTTGNPIFTQRTGVANPFNGVDIGVSSAPAVVDIDADGDFDVFIGNKAGSISYYQNTGTRNSPVFTNRTGVANPLKSVSVGSDSAPSFADIDGDGDFDALITDSSSTVQLITNFGNSSSPSFTKTNPLEAVSTVYTSAPLFVDIDGDGDLDVFIGGYFGTVQYFENTGTNLNPRFVQRTGAANPLNALNVGSYSAVAFVDIDGDSDQDAFVGAADGSTHFFQNTGTADSPVFTEMTGAMNPLDGVNVGVRSAPALVDIDGDNDYDIFIGAGDGTLHFYRNTGTPASPAFSFVSGAADPFNGVSVGAKSKPAFADIDGDGDFDLVIGSNTGRLRVFENTGSTSAPAYTERTGANNPLTAIDVTGDSAPALADIDGDGDIDVFIGGYYGTISYFRNDTLFADLAITQSVTPSPTLLQSPTDFRLTITNLGRDSGTGVTITDTLPAGATFISASSDDGGLCSVSTGVVTCLPNDILPNGVVHVDVRVSPTSLATLSNTASVTANELDSVQSNNQTAVSVSVNPAVDLGVTVIPSPSPVNTGTNLSYTVTISNQGPSTATGLTLSDVLPSGVTLVSATSASGTCTTAGSTYTCAMNDLPAGGSALVTLVVRPGVAGSLANTPSVTANETDLNVADNSATATVTVNPAADVGVAIVPSPNPVYAGTNLSYTVTISNQGPSTATGLTLSDALPSGVTLVSATSASGTCTTAGSTFTCAMNDLPFGGSALVTLVVRPGAAGLLANTPSISANETDLNTADNSATATVTVNPAADVGVAIIPSPNPVYAGTNLSYAVTINNQGPSTATGLTLSDALPSGVTLVSATSAGGTCTTAGSTYTCAMNDLPAGGSELVTLVVRPGVAGSLANTPSVTANETDLNVADNSATATVTVNPAVNLGITVAPSPSPVYTGANLSYAVTIDNQGPSTATGLILSNVLPGGVAPVSATSASGICAIAGSTVTCNLNNLPPGGTELVTLIAEPGVAGALYNVMNVSANETDLNPLDNSATATVAVNPAADVGVSIVPSQSTVYAGTNLSYTVTISNQGPSAATGLVLSDELPSGMSLVSATSTGGACTTTGSTVTCAMNNLTFGSSSFVTLAVRPGMAGSLTNALSITANETDLNATNNNAIATVTVDPAVDLGIAVMPSATQVYAGGNLSYAVTISNRGPSTATGLTLSGVLPSDVSWVSATTAGGTCTTAGSSVTCAMNDLSAGSDAPVTLVTRPGMAGPLANTLSITANEADLSPADNSAIAMATVHSSPDNNGGGTFEPWSLFALLGALWRRLLRNCSFAHHIHLPGRPHD